MQIGLSKDDRSTNANSEHWAAYTTVINCDAYRNADPATDYENADGFSCKCYAGKGNFFYGCRAWENADDGWDCFETEYDIVIENCWAWHNGDPSLWGFTSFNGDGNGFKLGGDGKVCPIIAKNCIGFNCFSGGKAFTDNNNGGLLTILNCTGWNCDHVFQVKSPAPVVKNNASFMANSGAKFVSVLSGDAVEDHNTWNLGAPAAGGNDFLDTAEAAAAAPREADGGLPKNGFGRLTSSSALIDKGVDVGIPYKGAAPDLGAYEFGMDMPAVPKSVFVITNSGVPMDITKSPTVFPSVFSLTVTSMEPRHISLRLTMTARDRAWTTVTMYNLLGNKAANLFNGIIEPHRPYEIRYDDIRLTSAVYFCVVQSGLQRKTITFVPIK